MIERNFDLFLNAGKALPLLINVNQYDHGEKWIFTLYNDDGTQYIPSTGAIVGVKSDGYGIINSGSIEDGKVVIMETEQMTAAVGKATFELMIDSQTHGTANFNVLVEAKPGNNATYSDSDVSLIQEAVDATSPLPTGGTVGQVLTKTAQGSAWSNAGTPTQAQVAEAVSDWADENITVTTGVVIDNSLSVAGAAADAKKTGDEISDLKSQISNSTGMSDDFKTALENLVNHLLFDDDDPTGQTYISALHDAMYPPAELVSISAVYSGGSVVQGASVNDLKEDLVVTALFDDETTETVDSADYTVSGDLSVIGTATITVTYDGKTTTFTVTVEEGEALLYELASTVSTKNYNTGVKLWSPEPFSHTVLCEATFANSGWTGKQAVLSHESGTSNNRQYRVGQDSTTAYKTALLIGGQAVSLFSSSSSMLRRFAYSYNATTGEVKAYAKNSGENISALKTFTAGTVNATEDTLRLNSGVTGTTIPVSALKVYGKVLSEQDMYDWVNALE